MANGSSVIQKAVLFCFPALGAPTAHIASDIAALMMLQTAAPTVYQ